ncbi:hypothetical protein Esti_000552 [Eimeria stiedai]
MAGGSSAPTRNGSATSKAATAADGDDLKFTSLLGVLVAFPTPEELEAFDPLASELPPALLPVNGLPLLDYGIESMQRNGEQITRQTLACAAALHAALHASFYRTLCLSVCPLPPRRSLLRLLLSLSSFLLTRSLSFFLSFDHGAASLFLFRVCPSSKCFFTQFPRVTELYVLVRDDAGGQAVREVVQRHQQRQQQQQQRYSSSSKHSPLRIHCILLPPAVKTVGDALRDFDSRVDVRSTFLLQSASTLVVGDLRGALEAHAARVSGGGRGADAALTWVLKVSPPCSRQRGLPDDAVLIYDSETFQLLSFSFLHSKRGVPVDEQLIAQATRGAPLRVRYDMSLPELYICQPSFLRLLGQSFDFGSLQRHLIPHLLKQDLRMETVYCHILEAERQPNGQLYAFSVRDPRAYLSLLRDVIERWTFPLAPDSHAMESQEYLKYRGKGVYQAATVSAAVGSCIGPLAAIEGDTTIADETEIRESLIGRRCSIGSGCCIVGSILLKEVTVEDGVEIRDSLIASNCIIKRGAVIGRGCLLASGVVVGEGVKLPPFTRCCRPESPAVLRLKDLEEAAAATGPLAAEAAAAKVAAAAGVSLGPDGKGTVFPCLGSSPPADFEACNVGASILHRIRLPLPKFEADDDETQSRASDACTAFSDTDGVLAASQNEQQEEEPFEAEISAMCLEALQQPQQQQHKILEMKSFRLACNKTDADIAEVVLMTMLQQLALKAPRCKARSFPPSFVCLSAALVTVWLYHLHVSLWKEIVDAVSSCLNALRLLPHVPLAAVSANSLAPVVCLCCTSICLLLLLLLVSLSVLWPRLFSSLRLCRFPLPVAPVAAAAAFSLSVPASLLSRIEDCSTHNHRCLQGWTSFVEAHRCRSLLLAFLDASADASCLFALWGRVVAFCNNKEIVAWDLDGEETRSPNPFEGPHGFCEVAELLHAADLFDVDVSLPRWAAAAAAAAAGDTADALAVESLRLLHAPSDVMVFLETPRLKAFVNWLQEDEDDESDASQN